VEPGQGLFALFQKYNLLDELIVFQSPKVLGDGLRPMKSEENFENLLNGLTLLSSEKCGADIKSTYKT
jgi:riboflavin biosynthesis pyrimidine reductase